MKNNQNRKVILKEHNPNWKEQFEEEKKKIQILLNKFDIKIEHVGSSSVPNLISKPIIDIAISIENLDISKEIINLLEINLDYHYDPTKNEKLPGRRHLWKGNKDVHSFHIWIVEFNEKDWKDMIYVRDYLRNNEDAREKYGNFKKQLIEKNINTIINYRNNKSKIYKQILSEAWLYIENK